MAEEEFNFNLDQNGQENYENPEASEAVEEAIEQVEASNFDFESHVTEDIIEPGYNDAQEFDLCAEIIVIITSLGSHRRQFFQSLRATNFLNCKGVIYTIVDCNLDVSQGADLIDRTLLEEWTARDLFTHSDYAETTGTCKFTVPQIFVDGVNLGDFIAMQDLEEDGDLNSILARKMCPSCLTERLPDDTGCSYCQVQYQQLIPYESIVERRVQRVYRGQLYFEDVEAA